MKKILFVIDTLRMGGAEKSLVTLLKSLDPRRVDVDLLVFEQGGILETEIPSWVNICYADSLTRGMTLEFKKYSRDILKNRHFMAYLTRIFMSLKARFQKNAGFSWDLVKKYISNHKGQYDVAVGYLEGFPDFYVLDKVDADRKIGWIHIDYTGRSLSKKEKTYYLRFDQLVTISDICKKAFVDQIPGVKNRIQVIENVVLPKEILLKSQEEVADGWLPDRHLLQLVTVGRLDYQKGMDIAAEAARMLKERKISFRWHVYGKGSMEEQIKALIREYNLDDCFILEGIRKNPYPYMRMADIIVQPSRFEGKSIVLDEAKILGKPIIVTNYPSVDDQIIDQRTGIIADITPDSIADNIEFLSGDSELMNTLGSNAGDDSVFADRIVNKFYNLIG